MASTLVFVLMAGIFERTLWLSTCFSVSLNLMNFTLDAENHRLRVCKMFAYSNAKIIKIDRVFPELWCQMYCHVFFRFTVYMTIHIHCALMDGLLHWECTVLETGMEGRAVIVQSTHAWYKSANLSSPACLCYITTLRFNSLNVRCVNETSPSQHSWTHSVRWITSERNAGMLYMVQLDTI